MQRHVIDDDSPTPVTMSSNTSFDSAFVSMAKFVEYNNVKGNDDYRSIHPALTAKIVKPTSVHVYYIETGFTTNTYMSHVEHII